MSRGSHGTATQNRKILSESCQRRIRKREGVRGEK